MEEVSITKQLILNYYAVACLSECLCCVLLLLPSMIPYCIYMNPSQIPQYIPCCCGIAKNSYSFSLQAQPTDNLRGILTVSSGGSLPQLSCSATVPRSHGSSHWELETPGGSSPRVLLSQCRTASEHYHGGVVHPAFSPGHGGEYYMKTTCPTYN